MSPLFMETGYEPSSPGSISAEDYTAGSEREGDGQQVGPTGKKRRDKNRDAARKSRKKQTERADVLHEELQRLERSNSALHKEIGALKKDLVVYTTALERHKPHCRLRASRSGSPSPSLGCRNRSGPAGVPPPRATSTLLAASPFSTSLTSSVALQTLDSVDDARTGSASSRSPADLFVASPPGPATASCSLPLLPAPHSLFADGPAVASRPADFTSVSTRLVSVPAAPGGLGVAPSAQDGAHKTSSLSADSRFSDTLDAFLTRQTSFIPAPCNVAPPYFHVATHHGGPAHGCDLNPYNNNPNTSNPLSSFLPSTLQESTVQSLTVSPQTNFPAFPPKPSYCQQTAPNPASLLSLLTVPNPPGAPPTTSSSSAQPPPPLPLLLDSSRDLSLTELLEVNDWILSGTSNV